MNFIDLIKDKFRADFASSLTVSDVFLTLITAFILGLFIVWIYKLTYTGVLLNKGFCLSLVLLSMITSVIIMTVVSNLSLSLGMVGALSIVRFRTAVKDPNDTLFMFWAIAAGIMTGADLKFIAAIATVFLGILYYVTFLNVISKHIKNRAVYSDPALLYYFICLSATAYSGCSYVLIYSHYASLSSL